jgi:hypothetical protein
MKGKCNTFKFSIKSTDFHYYLRTYYLKVEYYQKCDDSEVIYVNQCYESEDK